MSLHLKRDVRIVFHQQRYALDFRYRLRTQIRFVHLEREGVCHRRRRNDIILRHTYLAVSAHTVCLIAVEESFLVVDVLQCATHNVYIVHHLRHTIRVNVSEYTDIMLRHVDVLVCVKVENHDYRVARYYYVRQLRHQCYGTAGRLHFFDNKRFGSLVQ